MKPEYLRFLSISGNMNAGQSEGSTSLIQLLSAAKNLNELELNSTGVELVSLVNGIGQLPYLFRIDIGKNPVSNADKLADTLASFVTNSKTLSNIKLNGVQLTPMGILFTPYFW